MPTEHAIRFFSGWVSHTRQAPVKHQFKYRVFNIWLDVDKAEDIDKISPFWSSKRFNLVQFKRQNYLPGKNSISVTVKQKIKQQTGQDFVGKVYLLTNLRYWGYCYNPVSFYFCYDKHSTLCYILSEIHNTPWGERFTYVHTAGSQITGQGDDSSQEKNHQHDMVNAEFKKEFHVSPFMPMNLDYQWHFKSTQLNRDQGNTTKSRMLISMNLLQNNTPVFNATLNLTGSLMNKKQANLVPFKYPLMCIKVISAIYWHALKLWLKKVPFHSHPK